MEVGWAPRRSTVGERLDRQASDATQQRLQPRPRGLQALRVGILARERHGRGARLHLAEGADGWCMMPDG